MAAAHETIDSRGVGPIGFDGNDIEPMMLDQPARDGCPGTIEFGGAVGRLSEENELGIRETIERASEIRDSIERRQPVCFLPQNTNGLAFGICIRAARHDRHRQL